jgi:hypothetical protein
LHHLKTCLLLYDHTDSSLVPDRLYSTPLSLSIETRTYFAYMKQTADRKWTDVRFLLPSTFILYSSKDEPINQIFDLAYEYQIPGAISYVMKLCRDSSSSLRQESRYASALTLLYRISNSQIDVHGMFEIALDPIVIGSVDSIVV